MIAQINPIDPSAIRAVIRDICHSVARCCGCDPADVLDEVSAILALTVHVNGPLRDPERYLRRSAHRAAFRLCKERQKRWLFERPFDAERPVEIRDRRQRLPLDELINAEEETAVNREMGRLAPDERDATDRVFGRTNERTQKKDYYLKDRGIAKIRCALQRGGFL